MRRRQQTSGPGPHGKVRARSMASAPKKRKSQYTSDRNMPGAFDGETVTRRGLMTGGAMAVGGLATAASRLPALGLAWGPNFSETEPNRWQDVGPVAGFNQVSYLQTIIELVTNAGDSG